MNLTDEGMKKALDDIDNDPELGMLERMLTEFNLFETVGLVRGELFHSDFLAFLFDPKQTHGLGDKFAQEFMRRIAFLTSHPLTNLDMTKLIALREKENIDILLLLEDARIAVIIENKIDSEEIPGQLKRYMNRVRHLHKGWTVIGLFLTPHNKQPTHKEYTAIDYTMICEVLESVISDDLAEMEPSVSLSIKQYTKMLRRNVVEDPQTAALCRKLYEKHRIALDILIEYGPKRQTDLDGFLVSLIKDARLILCPGDKDKGIHYTRFSTKEWDVEQLKLGKAWPKSDRILLFEFVNELSGLFLKLTIGRGDSAIRFSLVEMICAVTSFQANQPLGNSWYELYHYPILGSSEYWELSLPEIKEKIREKWEYFLGNDLPKIRNAIRIEELP